MSAKIKDCWCVYCGHPVMAEGVAIDPDDDTDREGHERDRCADTACQSTAAARYMGGVLVAVDVAH